VKNSLYPLLNIRNTFYKDAYEHLTSFNSRMKLQQNIHTLKGIFLSFILKRFTYLWLSHLLKRSMKLWKQLDEMFISRLSTCEIINKSLICLIGSMHKYDKTLSSFTWIVSMKHPNSRICINLMLYSD
jgi:hypothetical protein